MFRMAKCQFGHRKVRYRGIVKNAAQVFALLALANLYRAAGRLRLRDGDRGQTTQGPTTKPATSAILPKTFDRNCRKAITEMIRASLNVEHDGACHGIGGGNELRNVVWHEWLDELIEPLPRPRAEAFAHHLCS